MPLVHDKKINSGGCMKIEHIAVWSMDIDKLRDFYIHYFGAASNKKYINEKKGFSSYFLSFKEGPRLELMSNNRLDILPDNGTRNYTGPAHFAFSAGSPEKVDELTALLKKDGYEVLDGPRRTGDGYYESVVLDPEGNRIEITV